MAKRLQAEKKKGAETAPNLADDELQQEQQQQPQQQQQDRQARAAGGLVRRWIADPAEDASLLEQEHCSCSRQEEYEWALWRSQLRGGVSSHSDPTPTSEKRLWGAGKLKCFTHTELDLSEPAGPSGGVPPVGVPMSS